MEDKNYDMHLFHRPLWIAVGILLVLGVLAQFSVSRGNAYPWTIPHIIRIAVGLTLTMGIISMNGRYLLQYAWHIYGLTLLLTLLVDIIGISSKGSTRWLNMGFINIQPSELMKIATILAIARYYHPLDLDKLKNIRHHLIPLLLTITPALLILIQPDLGTAASVIFIGVVLIYLGGLSIRYFMSVLILGLISIPILWNFVLHGYQRNRVLTLIDPGRDPYGAGYQVIQSKIAVGAGGFFGRGYLQGSQAQLDFLPEKQTDFIFAVLMEEFGFLGALVIIGAYGFFLYIAMGMIAKCGHTFGKLAIAGFATLTFFHVLINISMVIGIFPVVGVPLPLISYGGTSMVTILIGFGIMQNVYNTRL